MEETLAELLEHIADQMGEQLLDSKIACGELTIKVPAERIARILKFLRDDTSCRFTVLIDVCGVDYPEREHRFDVVYHLLSPTRNLRCRVKIETDAETAAPSACEVYPCANWFEREAFDLYGIRFSGHPDLRRILTDYGFNGHPLRKDFPLTGFVEVRYDDERRRVVYEPVRLSQELRTFDFLSPWEGTEYVLPGDEKAEGAGRG